MGCSSTQFIYNRLDTLIRWSVDDYIDLDRDQQQVFDDQLDTLLLWHRREELPRYDALLSRLDDALLDGAIDVRTGADIYDGLSDALVRFRQRSVDFMVGFGTEVSQQQRLEFVAHLLERQVELEEELLSRTIEEYRDEAHERFEDNLNDYLGPLSEAQSRLIASAVEQLVRIDEPWLVDRRRWIEEMDDILRARESAWQAPVRSLIAARFDERQPAYAAAIEANTLVGWEAVRQVVNLRSERQDRRLKKKITDFREDITVLVEREI
ncbi:conserved hypothetical protein [Luminiphilus syltensis NOR5-1B]|uniref:Lipoprotein n=1 Tax=Luminiphilus syltensis NOR5-1B TaxID=565045 RepID=B8KUK2_9GAMM|nr:DUF6279 family lipoprotein [Luminiphilus syltensis]EED35051.1 conserved hypothetical protein [Luminiphilus syltensis NOR5-1B]